MTLQSMDAAQGQGVSTDGSSRSGRGRGSVAPIPSREHDIDWFSDLR